MERGSGERERVRGHCACMIITGSLDRCYKDKVRLLICSLCQLDGSTHHSSVHVRGIDVLFVSHGKVILANATKGYTKHVMMVQEYVISLGSLNDI